jgi:hypothetical protein
MRGFNHRNRFGGKLLNNLKKSVSNVQLQPA